MWHRPLGAGKWGKWGGSRSFAFRLIAILLQWIQQGPFCTLPGSNYEMCPLDLDSLLTWQRSPCTRSNMEYVLLKDLDNLVFHWIEINDGLVQMWIHQMIERRSMFKSNFVDLVCPNFKTSCYCQLLLAEQSKKKDIEGRFVAGNRPLIYFTHACNPCLTMCSHTKVGTLRRTLNSCVGWGLHQLQTWPYYLFQHLRLKAFNHFHLLRWKQWVINWGHVDEEGAQKNWFDWLDKNV